MEPSVSLAQPLPPPASLGTCCCTTSCVVNLWRGGLRCRRWLLQRAIALGCLTAEHITRELDACTRVATTYPRNYFAWTHRMRLLPLLADGSVCILRSCAVVALL